MNILIVHEIDWLKKVIFEPHHLAELFSLKGHEVFVVDCEESNIKKVANGLHTSVLSQYNRVYKSASITLIRPPSILIKGLNRLTHFFTCKNVIKKVITENGIDVILLYGVATNGIQTIEIAKKMKIPVILRVLDIAHGLIKIPILRQLTKKYEKVVISSANEVLATTPDLSRYTIEMGAKKENAEYFPYGINKRDFKPMKKDLKLANHLGITEKDRVIIFIGTIYHFSGIDDIIYKFEILRNKLKNIKFLIIGGGPNFRKIKSLVNKRKLESDIILTGFKPQQELPRYISLADVCVNPFVVNFVTDRIIPAKILEYLACGKPVLSTPLKGTKELLPNENYGIIYSTSDIILNQN